jgi:hypothetical protein
VTLRGKYAVPLLLVLAAGMFIPGINWGLPSARVDSFLFGGRTPWTGKQILALAGSSQDADRGADVASHAGVDRNVPVIVNATDAERARIVRRYRLMSYQPDEWNTLKSLSEMNPRRGNFDPKLYQYGGLWVYPVGAMLKLASMLHLIDLRADVTWYLDHPEAFGRFYIVARLWSVMWAFVGVFAVYAIVRRITGGRFVPFLAGVGFCLMPVVVNMAHEAKPHLAGTVLMLLAVLAAARYAELEGRWRWIGAGALCGAALGMVLTTMPIFLILPGMVLLRKSSWGEKLRAGGGAAAVGILVYLVTNPYVPFNFIFHRAVLESNLGNSKAMYHPALTLAGIKNAASLMAAGTSPVLAIAGVVGAIALGIRAVRVRKRREPAEIRRRTTGLLLAIPALAIFGQCVLVAAGKPGEFGRFMLLPDIFLLIEAMVAIATFCWPERHAVTDGGPSRGSASPATHEFLVGWAYPPTVSPPSAGNVVGEYAHPTARVENTSKTRARAGSSCHWEWAAAISLILVTAISGISYLRAFMRDCRPITSRLAEAERLRALNPHGAETLATYADPAPYCLPPVDLFDGKVVSLAKDADPAEGVKMGEISVRAVDISAKVDGSWTGLFTATPISWADKQFDVRTRK